MLGLSELRAREASLRSDQAKRVEKEQRRLEKERHLAERQRKREQQREEEKTRRRLEAAEAEQQAQARREELTEHNRGVYFCDSLHALPLDEVAVASRGIRRASDKIRLPPSAGAGLMAQDAPRNGAMQFELATLGGASTHAGLLEFTAREGTVELPARVADCLWGRERHGLPMGPVTVTYKRLDRGTFVRFQPLTAGFHEAAGEHMREVLEAALMTATAISEGDVVRVDVDIAAHMGSTTRTGADADTSTDVDMVGGDGSSGQGEQQDGSARSGGAPTPQSFCLLVKELQPGPAVSLIDTDIEAEVVPSLETEQALEALQAEQDRLVALHAEREAEALARLAEERQAANDAAAASAAERAALAASLPDEPPVTSAVDASAAGDALSATASCVLRLPDGARLSRRVRLSDPPGLLFAVADASGAGGLPRGGYRLVMQYPRRVMEPGAGGTLADVGLSAGATEAMMLEAVDANADLVSN